MRPPLGRLRLPSGFPLGPPTWPTTLERPPEPARTGVNYNTDWSRRMPARMARALVVDGVLRPASHLVARPAVSGADRISTLAGPAIFAANHHSHLDTALVLGALPERFRHRAVTAAAADYFFSSRLAGAVSSLAIGAIPMERNRVERQSADLAADLVAEGWNLVIFPEGGRSPDGWGRTFRGGAAYLALRTGCPVVPIHLAGTGNLWKRGQHLPRPARRGEGVLINIGEPLVPDAGEDARRFSARIEAAVAALGDESATDWWSARRRAADGSTPDATGPQAADWRRAWARTAPAGTAASTWP
ncbi:MAG: lysophospholipid acyltransferase family protein [Acidimicrobiales bacterium]